MMGLLAHKLLFFSFRNVLGSGAQLASYSVATGDLPRWWRDRGVKLTNHLDPVGQGVEMYFCTVYLPSYCEDGLYLYLYLFYYLFIFF